LFFTSKSQLSSFHAVPDNNHKQLQNSIIQKRKQKAND